MVWDVNSGHKPWWLFESKSKQSSLSGRDTSGTTRPVPQYDGPVARTNSRL